MPNTMAMTPDQKDQLLKAMEYLAHTHPKVQELLNMAKDIPTYDPDAPEQPE